VEKDKQKFWDKLREPDAKGCFNCTNRKYTQVACDRHVIENHNGCYTLWNRASKSDEYAMSKQRQFAQHPNHLKYWEWNGQR